MKRYIFWIILLATSLALIDSSYLFYLHYSDHDSFCDISPSLDCGIVNKGEFSTIDGPINHVLGTYLNIPIPNALVSIITFGFVLLSVIFVHKNRSFLGISPKRQLIVLKTLLILSLLYALFLVYIEAFVLLTWCILCIILDILIIAALIAFSFVEVRNK